MSARAVAWVGIATAVFAGGCLSLIPVQYSVEPIPDVYGCESRLCADSDQVRVEYLGVSGFTIAYRGRVLLTAPLFSNPNFDDSKPHWMHWLWHSPNIHSDSSLVDRLLPQTADSASMIVVGHGHYDHLLDVPYVARAHARTATIYGSPTVRHMLMGDSTLRANGRRVVAIEKSDVGTFERPGRWWYSPDSTFRIMALEANHAPTIRIPGFRMTFANGFVDHDLDALPKSAEDWKLGEVYTYLIDVLDHATARPRLRIYYQDAPNSAPKGFPPASVLAERPVDLAILCVATARNTRPVSPDSLLNLLRPKWVIASHWESFFRPQTYPLMLNPTSHVDEFMASLHRTLPVTSKWVMPNPRTKLRYATQ